MMQLWDQLSCFAHAASPGRCWRLTALGTKAKHRFKLLPPPRLSTGVSGASTWWFYCFWGFYFLRLAQFEHVFCGRRELNCYTPSFLNVLNQRCNLQIISLSIDWSVISSDKSKILELKLTSSNVLFFSRAPKYSIWFNLRRRKAAKWKNQKQRCILPWISTHGRFPIEVKLWSK